MNNDEFQLDSRNSFAFDYTIIPRITMEQRCTTQHKKEHGIL